MGKRAACEGKSFSLTFLKLMRENAGGVKKVILLDPPKHFKSKILNRWDSFTTHFFLTPNKQTPLKVHHQTGLEYLRSKIPANM